MDIRSLIRKIPDYPSPGTTYYDLTPLMTDDAGFHALIDELAARYAPRGIRKFACMEWRGFIIGAALAYRLRRASGRGRTGRLTRGGRHRERA